MRYHNKPYDQLKVGDSAELRRICTEDDFFVFASNSGNHNPLHLANEDGDGDTVNEAIAPAMFVGALISAVLGNILPGAGTLYKSQSFEFVDRAHAGDELLARVTVAQKCDNREVVMDTEVIRPDDDAVIVTGTAVVIAPEKELSFSDIEVPGLVVQRHRHFDALLDRSRPLPPIPTAVVAPEEPNSLGGALLAAKETIIDPILVGDPDKIQAAAREIDLRLGNAEIVPVRDHFDAAGVAVDLVVEGRAQALMKGHLHTDDLLRAALRKEHGLRAGRRFTHVFVMDVPGQPHPLLVTDAAINIEPDLETKIDITQNAIDLAISIGIQSPKAGILSAVETVNPAIRSSIDAALLSKMAERGQIRGGLVDGPLAMDNAVSLAAARTKGIVSEVAGRADILVVPNLDAGNMLAKQLTYIAHAEGAGVVLGAKVPIILNSRADDDKARLASCAVAALHAARMAERI
ncbi:bifunctional enoyl-CoA hydratase/phosphate acetyltransferase [Roseibium sp. RKSG952]|uniref:bifunctional enoyl-CoA hydratase/phosphate acetyltransferase n=1 Tax=Roseibium sp. RKSG952 TaxID=2529384 RepID=UPI0012BC21A4|nr:bifunctional enoyl-CoA hydratase/phosphate acetyltransferase [Roseibium sp. RKSG952]MTH99004.1 bifunctional enoyl-CoA hydratase/phosphate acetyltransferase [Roseibium sp. RKSG952]